MKCLINIKGYILFKKCLMMNQIIKKLKKYLMNIKLIIIKYGFFNIKIENENNYNIYESKI